MSMSHTLTRALSVATVLLLAACTRYRPASVLPDEEWQTLQRIRLTELVAASAGEVSLVGAFPAFDYSDGLSSEEAAGLAVVMNPALRAARHERGIAQGQLVSAGLLPNPEIESIWIFPGGPVSWAGEVNALFDLTRALVTRGPRREQARIRLREVHWEIADEEWQLVNDVRRAFVDILYWNRASEVNLQQQEAIKRTVSSIRVRHSLGAATELELLVAEADLAEIKRQQKRLKGDRELALQHLNQLMGLPPMHPTEIQPPANPLAYSPVSGDPGALVERIRSRRPDVLAAEQAYLGAEKELQLAHRGRIPLLQAGPSYEGVSSDADGNENNFGFGVSLELPVFDRKQGEIASALAERAHRRDLYVARLHTARSEFHRAWTDRATLDEELSFYFSDIAPRLDRSLYLTEKAFGEGELDLLQVLIVQARVLQSMRDILDQLRDFHRAEIEVQRSIGPEQLREPGPDPVPGGGSKADGKNADQPQSE